jgi:GxxExxY protein
MKYSELTGRIIGCAMEVHKSLGNGFQEVIYQRALGIEFDFKKLLYVREEEKPVFYRDIPIGSRRVDFIVENNILIELKAISKLDDVHLAQAINYMEAFKMEICLLINFGSRSMEFRRLENKKLLR